MITRAKQAKIDQVLKAFGRHPHGGQLISAAGLQRDSLLRALIPLYVCQRYGSESLVTSGVTQAIWWKLGVDVQATVMAKALREHIGYARRTRDGIRITPNGIKYVEAALR